MNKLKIVSGILCLVGSFVFFWSGVEVMGLSGLGIIHIIDVIQYFSSSHEYVYLIGYLFGVITTFSGIFILISRKSKVIPI
jgi:TRAP-type C4-dicarboxylate transport system permease small subunit